MTISDEREVPIGNEVQKGHLHGETLDAIYISRKHHHINCTLLKSSVLFWVRFAAI